MSLDLSAEQAKRVAEWAKSLMDIVSSTKDEKCRLELGLSTARGWAMEETPCPVTDTVSEKQPVGAVPDAIRGKGGHSDPTLAKALSWLSTCRRCHSDIDLRGKQWTICRSTVTRMEDGVAWREKCGARVYADRDGKDPMHGVMINHLDALGEAISDVVADVRTTTPIVGSARIRAERDPKSKPGERICDTDTCEDPAVAGRSFCAPCLEYKAENPQMGSVPASTVAERVKKRKQRDKKKLKGVHISGPLAEAVA